MLSAKMTVVQSPKAFYDYQIRAAFFGFFAHARQDGVQVPADGGGAFVGKMGVVVGRVVGHDFVQQAVEVLRD